MDTRLVLKPYPHALASSLCLLSSDVWLLSFCLFRKLLTNCGFLLRLHLHPPSKYSPLAVRLANLARAQKWDHSSSNASFWNFRAHNSIQRFAFTIMKEFFIKTLFICIHINIHAIFFNFFCLFFADYAKRLVTFWLPHSRMKMIGQERIILLQPAMFKTHISSTLLF